jgi:tetratricopeptide (TPR) repeat protein
MPQEKTITLEIIREGDTLKMSIAEQKDLSATLRHYSQHKVDFAEIDKLCHEVTLLLNKPGFDDFSFLRSLKKATQALWDHLLTRSVKEKLRANLNYNLLLEIDEELIFIPWELLYDGDNFLSLNFNLGRLVRTQSKAPVPDYRSLSHVFKMLVLANPTNDLKAAYLEGLSIRNQFDRKHRNIRIDFKSTSIDKLYVKKNICDYDIVHFAGHCEYGYHNAKESGWVLSDGNFGVGDILRLGSGSSLPALVFSNACHSAPLSKEGLIDFDYQKKNYSLAGAFLFSGVRHYIGSIRKIEDKASLTFAKEFYHNLTLGKSLGESLRLSRLKLVKDYGLSSMHWANYLLYGDPGFILFKPKQNNSKVKKSVVLPKRWLSRFLLLMALGSLLAWLYFLLPTINPSAYFLFLKSKALFAKGANQEVITAGKRIIAKDKNFLDIYPILADTYLKIGERDNAVKYYFDYVLLAEKLKDNRHLAAAYISIGWFYHLDGEYKKARDFYEKALALSRKLRDKLNEAVALRRMAVWHIDHSDYDLALELLTKSSEINRQRQHLDNYRYNLACDYFDIGLVFSNKDDFAAAEEFYRKSRKLFEKVNLKNELSDYYFNLGEIYSFEKQYEKALAFYLMGLKIDLNQGNKMNLASDYNMIGELYLEMDRFIEAESNFNQALTISKEIKSRPDIAGTYYNLGILYKKLGRMSKSKEYLRNAQEIYGIIDPLAYEEVKKEILSLN